MKAIERCCECAYYSIRKHKCKRGAKDKGEPTATFYTDCPLDEAEIMRHGRWIKCEDKLPPFGEDVLMLFESNMAVGYRREKDFWRVRLDNGYIVICETRPLCWMPLPERPKE